MLKKTVNILLAVLMSLDLDSSGACDNPHNSNVWLTKSRAWYQALVKRSILKAINDHMQLQNMMATHLFF